MGNPDEEIAAFDKLIATYSSGTSPAIREQVAKAMVNKGFVLGEMEKPDEAIATFDKLIAAYSSDTSPAIREVVAKAMVNKGVALGKVGKPDEAITTYDKLIATYSSDNTPSIREVVAKAMVGKGVALGEMGKPDEEIATYDKLTASYSSDNTPAIRDQVAEAYNGKGFTRLMAAKKAWPERELAVALLHQARSDLLASLELNPDSGMARGNLAYTQWLIGDRQAAEESFRAALAAAEDGGEELYRGTLDDIAQHPISDEDNSFRAMVEGQWAEYRSKGPETGVEQSKIILGC